MAGMVVTITEIAHASVKLIKFAWTTDSGTATATGTTTGYYTGKILGLATDPSAGGTQPDDDYDITVTDTNSLDVLMGGGADRDETNTEYVLSTSLGSVVESQLTINVSAAGNSNVGAAYLYIR